MTLTNAVRPVRRKLIQLAIAGHFTFRVYGSGKEWRIVVQTPNRVVDVYPENVFPKMSLAQLFIMGKFDVKPAQLKVSKPKKAEAEESLAA